MFPFSVPMLLAGLLAPVLATPTATSAASVASVLTPGGFRPADKVREIPAGATIQHTGTETRLIDANGTVIFTSTKTDASSSGNTRIRSTKREDDALGSGWVAYGYWNPNGAQINSYNATWTVPALPTANDGQVLYYYNGLEPSSGDVIIQAALQYGATPAGGGESWGIAAWWVTSDGSALFTPLIPVSPGQSLQGIIQLDGTSDGTFNYSANFVGEQVLTVQTTEEMGWGAITLEMYNVAQDADLPSGFEPTVFSDIDIGLTGGNGQVSWTEVWDSQDGIYAFVTDPSGASDNEVSISYIFSS